MAEVSASQVSATDPQPPAVAADAPTGDGAQPAAEAPTGPDGFLASVVETLQNLVTSLVTFVQSLFWQNSPYTQAPSCKAVSVTIPGLHLPSKVEACFIVLHSAENLLPNDEKDAIIWPKSPKIGWLMKVSFFHLGAAYAYIEPYLRSLGLDVCVIIW